MPRINSIADLWNRIVGLFTPLKILKWDHVKKYENQSIRIKV